MCCVSHRLTRSERGRRCAERNQTQSKTVRLKELYKELPPGFSMIFMMFNILSCIYIYSECSVILRIQGCGAVVQRCENTSENNRRLGEGSWLLRTEEGQASFLCLQERLYRCAEKDRGEGHSHQQHCKGHCKSTYGFILYYINSTSTPT